MLPVGRCRSVGKRTTASNTRNCPRSPHPTELPPTATQVLPLRGTECALRVGLRTRLVASLVLRESNALCESPVSIADKELQQGHDAPRRRRTQVAPGGAQRNPGSWAAQYGGAPKVRTRPPVANCGLRMRPPLTERFPSAGADPGVLLRSTPGYSRASFQDAFCVNLPKPTSVTHTPGSRGF